jgi:hypothetical protein
MEIISRKEAKILGLKRYFTGKACVNGHITERTVSSEGCMECSRLRAIGKVKSTEEHDIAIQYGKRVSRKQAKQEGLKHYFTCHPCKFGHIAKRYVHNGECFECANGRALLRDKEKAAAAVMRYYYKNSKAIIAKTVLRHRLTGYNAQRRATKLRAMPKWADIAAIKAIYAQCPKGYHVDHIYPLKGKNVCGLHVAENLQILPAQDNLRKSNKC